MFLISCEESRGASGYTTYRVCNTSCGSRRVLTCHAKNWRCSWVKSCSRFMWSMVLVCSLGGGYVREHSFVTNQILVALSHRAFNWNGYRCSWSTALSVLDLRVFLTSHSETCIRSATRPPMPHRITNLWVSPPELTTLIPKFRARRWIVTLASTLSTHPFRSGELTSDGLPLYYWCVTVPLSCPLASTTLSLSYSSPISIWGGISSSTELLISYYM